MTTMWRVAESYKLEPAGPLDKFESVCGLHISAVRQLDVCKFVAFYALILDLFAPPRCSILHLIRGPVSLLGGPAPPGVPVILILCQNRPGPWLGMVIIQCVPGCCGLLIDICVTGRLNNEHRAKYVSNRWFQDRMTNDKIGSMLID